MLIWIHRSDIKYRVVNSTHLAIFGSHNLNRKRHLFWHFSGSSAKHVTGQTQTSNMTWFNQMSWKKSGNSHSGPDLFDSTFLSRTMLCTPLVGQSMDCQIRRTVSGNFLQTRQTSTVSHCTTAATHCGCPSIHNECMDLKHEIQIFDQWGEHNFVLWLYWNR